MILWVYAMWKQSKKILYILLFMFVPQIIAPLGFHGIYNDPNTYLSGMFQLNCKLNWNLICSPPVSYQLSLVTVIEVIDFSFCSISFSNASHFQVMWGTAALRFVFSAVLLILAVIPTVKQSVMLYKATKQWQPNCYMQLFVKDGFFYFLV